MWFSKLFKDRSKAEKSEAPPQDPINQGVFYLYFIMGAQVLFVFGLIAVLTAFGSFLATPTWVFVLAFVAGAWGIVALYRKIKRKLGRLMEAVKGANLGGQNYEISLMGGAFTMRVESSPARPLLEAPAASPIRDTLIDAETIDAETVPSTSPPRNAAS